MDAKMSNELCSNLLQLSTQVEEHDCQDLLYDDDVPNPLLYTEILENLAIFLDYENLKNIRLVCSAWNVSLFPIFNSKSKVVVRIVEGEKEVGQLERLNGKKYKSLEVQQTQFIECHNQTFPDWMTENGKGFEWLSLKGPGHGHSSIRAEYSISKEIFRSILIDWCPNLKELIVGDEKGEMVLLQELVPKDNPSPAQVKKINLKTLSFAQGTQECFESVATEIFGLLASLRTLQISQYLNFTEFTDLVNNLRNTGAMNVLENLVELKFTEIYGRSCSSNLFSSLALIEFKYLTTLEMTYRDHLKFQDTSNLMTLLGTSSFAQLEHLKLGRVNCSERLVFPRLSSLKTFEAIVGEWNLSSLDFMLQFPKLEKLTLEFFSAFPRPPSLLQLCGSNPRVIFRNLRQLHLLRVNGEDYNQVIGSCFPNLEVLCVDSSMNFPLVSINTYLSCLSSHKRLQELELHRGLAEHLEQTIIDHLPHFQSLRKLSLYSLKGEVLLTTDMFERGFLRAPSLRLAEFHSKVVIPIPEYEYLVRLISKTKLVLRLVSGWLLDEAGHIKDRIPSEFIN